MVATEIDNTKRVALVIGSGNLKCAAALGLMKVLQREGIEVDMAVGCSGGSLYAAAIALGYDVDTTLDFMQRVWTREVYTRYDYRNLLRALLLLRIPSRSFGISERFGLVDDRPLMRGLEIAFGDKTFDQTRIPLHIVATDLTNGEKVVLSDGRVVDACRASIAMPIVFPPLAVGGRLLVDGGYSDPLPVDVAIREGSEVIIAMGFESPYVSQATSLAGLVRQTSVIMMNNLIRSTYAFYNLAHHAEIVPVIPSFKQHIGLADTHLFPYIIEEGERAAEEQVPYLRRLLAAPAIR